MADCESELLAACTSEQRTRSEKAVQKNRGDAGADLVEEDMVTGRVVGLAPLLDG